MTLRERIERRFGIWSDPVRESYLDLAQHLARAEAAAAALKQGSRMPDFLLPNAEGKLVALHDLLARGPVIVTFFRGEWCPLCNLTLAALEEALPRIESAGATLVALTPETGGLALRAKRRGNLHYEVLCDVDNAVALQFGIVFQAPERYRRLLEGVQIDLGKRHGNDAWLLPMPAAFVGDREGVVRYALVSGDIRERADPDELVEVIRAL